MTRARGPEPRYSSSSSLLTRFFVRAAFEFEETRLLFISDEELDPEAFAVASTCLRFLLIGASASRSLSEDTEVREDKDEVDLDDDGAATFCGGL